MLSYSRLLSLCHPPPTTHPIRTVGFVPTTVTMAIRVQQYIYVFAVQGKIILLSSSEIHLNLCPKLQLF